MSRHSLPSPVFKTKIDANCWWRIEKPCQMNNNRSDFVPVAKAEVTAHYVRMEFERDVLCDLGANLRLCVSHFPLKWKFEYTFESRIWLHFCFESRVKRDLAHWTPYTIDDHSMKAHNRFGAMILLNVCMHFFRPFLLPSLLSFAIWFVWIFKGRFFKSIPLNCVWKQPWSSGFVCNINKTEKFQEKKIQNWFVRACVSMEKYVGTLLIGWALLGLPTFLAIPRIIQ